MPRLRPPSTLSGLISGLDDFVLHRMSRPLWILGWMLFVGSVYFVATFYSSAGETQASIDRDTAAIEIKTNESNEVARVYDVLSNAWSAVLQVSSFYTKNLAGRSKATVLSDELISEGSRLSTNARKQLATAIGTISAVRFTDPQLAAHSDGLRSDMEDADKVMGAFEHFFKTYSVADAERAVAQLQELDQDLMGAQRDAAAAITRAEVWPKRAEVLMNDLIAEVGQRNARQRSLVIRFYLSSIAAFYAIVFLIVGFRVWQNSWKAGPAPQERKKRIGK